MASETRKCGDVKIWVVDDNRVTAHLVVAILRANGFNGEHYKSGGEAIEALRGGDDKWPDIILLDLCMPQPDGNAVLQVIDELSGPPVVLLTANSALVHRDVSHLPVGVLLKPYHYEDLLEIVNKVLGKGNSGKKE